MINYKAMLTVLSNLLHVSDKNTKTSIPVYLVVLQYIPSHC